MLDAEQVKLLDVLLIRSHFEYAIPVWNPCLIKNIDNLQQRATRLVPKERAMSIEWKLWDQPYWKLRGKEGNLIQFYKIINRIDHVNLTNGVQEKKIGVLKAGQLITWGGRESVFIGTL